MCINSMCNKTQESRICFCVGLAFGVTAFLGPHLHLRVILHSVQLSGKEKRDFKRWMRRGGMGLLRYEYGGGSSSVLARDINKVKMHQSQKGLS